MLNFAVSGVAFIGLVLIAHRLSQVGCLLSQSRTDSVASVVIERLDSGWAILTYYELNHSSGQPTAYACEGLLSHFQR